MGIALCFKIGNSCPGDSGILAKDMYSGNSCPGDRGVLAKDRYPFRRAVISARP
jgi:hypothetical protein